jgi:hypothetical protein
MRKIIILKHGGGELANQLWNYISVYACGLEMQAEVKNPSFFEYHHSFKLIQHEDVITRFFAFWFKNHSGRRDSRRNRFWRKTYLTFTVFMRFFDEENIVSSENDTNSVIYLPPTSPFPRAEKKEIAYLVGWLFRNPVGIQKYRKQLVGAFAPHKKIEDKVTEIILPLREKYEKIIGIHIRQADYSTFKGGIYMINQTRVKEIVDEYIQKYFIEKDKTLFLITSDGSIEAGIFRNLNTYISKENAITDLFLLSSTDAIIGSDSSFGAFASWYGNIPHIVMTKNPMDWKYYEDKKNYFQNKYSKMVQY